MKIEKKFWRAFYFLIPRLQQICNSLADMLNAQKEVDNKAKIAKIKLRMATCFRKMKNMLGALSIVRLRMSIQLSLYLTFTAVSVIGNDGSHSGVPTHHGQACSHF